MAEAVAAGVGAVAGVYAFWRAHVRSTRQRRRFDDKLFGVPVDTETGTPATPGIFERFDQLTTAVEQLHNQVTSMEADVGEVKILTQQLRRNGGSSVFDTVHKVSNSLTEHLENSMRFQDTIDKRLARIEAANKIHPEETL
jgi:hypothetical protein